MSWEHEEDLIMSLRWSKSPRFEKYMVMFYGISSIVGYLMPNPIYKYILNIYDFWPSG